MLSLLGSLLGKVADRITFVIGGGKKEVHRITSHSQQGGITAHTVNIAGIPQRQLSEESRKQPINLLGGKSMNVSLAVVMGDVEAFTFAEEIKGGDSRDVHALSGEPA